jgi:inorganic pyrophosphatase
MKQHYLVLVIMLVVSLSSCKTDYAKLPTYSNTRQLQAVIEVPAGTNQQIEYNRQSKEFENGKEAGKDKVIKFLPYPGNFGFIPSTELEKDGRGLNVFVIAESVATSTVMDILPIASLLLEDAEGEIEALIIAVPARPSKQLISATDYKELSQHNPAVKQILQQWFTHREPGNRTKVVGWKDEIFAEKEIQRWMDL